MFGRATIALGIGPHSSFIYDLNVLCSLVIADCDLLSYLLVLNRQRPKAT